MNHGDLITRERFGNRFNHLQWVGPPGGDHGKQTNGNSVEMIQSRSEIQVMNTPSRRGGPERPKFNKAGSIDRQRGADHNANLSAGVRQTYDIRFRAPRWEGDRKVGHARITLWWSGVLVHAAVEVADETV